MADASWYTGRMGLDGLDGLYRALRRAWVWNIGGVWGAGAVMVRCMMPSREFRGIGTCQSIQQQLMTGGGLIIHRIG